MIRRIARILPLYYLVLVVVKGMKRRDLAWLFEHATFQKADGHFWSIPQEELFYVLLPILMGCLALPLRFLPRVPGWGTAAALLLAIQLTHPVVRLNGNGAMLPFYLNVFIIGFCLAWVWSTNPLQAFKASARRRSRPTRVGSTRPCPRACAPCCWSSPSSREPGRIGRSAGRPCACSAS